MFRAPLAPKNVDSSTKSSIKSKKVRSLTPHLDRQTTLEILRKVNDCASPNVQIRITEEDLTKPIAERVTLIYLMILNVLFEVDQQSLSLAPIDRPVDYPEMFEDFHSRLNFLKVMRRLMNACLLPESDFNVRDIVNPTPKRVQYHLGAIANYIQFHNYIETICETEQDEQKMQEITEKIGSLEYKNSELKQEIAQLQQQKIDEKELEDELTKQLGQYQHHHQEIQSHVEVMKKRLADVLSYRQSVDDNLSTLNEELDRLQIRVEDLQSQVVTSPEELEQNMAAITEQLEEARIESNEVIQTAAMWENLSNRAVQIPPVIESTIEEIDGIIQKCDVASELDTNLENLQTEIMKSKQALKEASSKHQNLTERVKLLVEEKAGLSLEQTRRSAIIDQDLYRDLQLLQKEMENKQEQDTQLYLEIEQQKQQLTHVKERFAYIESLHEAQVKALKTSYEKYRGKMTALNMKLKTTSLDTELD